MPAHLMEHEPKRKGGQRLGSLPRVARRIFSAKSQKQIQRRRTKMSAPHPFINCADAVLRADLVKTLAAERWRFRALWSSVRAATIAVPTDEFCVHRRRG